jgi:PadR family transcriptional regulator PadR
VRTAAHDGRLRKYSHIASAGIARIEDFKNEWKEVVSIWQFVAKEEAQQNE